MKQYRVNSPARDRFFDYIRAYVKPGERVIEFGCGTGRALKALETTNPIQGVDIAENCLSEDVPLKVACLWNPIGLSGDVGYCCDVMEHIPTDRVADVFREIMCCVPRCLFIICKLPDKMGEKLISQKLHLTVKEDGWWIGQAEAAGNVAVLFSDGRTIALSCER